MKLSYRCERCGIAGTFEAEHAPNPVEMQMAAEQLGCERALVGRMCGTLKIEEVKSNGGISEGEG